MGISKGVFLGIGVAIVVALAITLNLEENETTGNESMNSAQETSIASEERILKAAIIDQLHDEFPNKIYQQNATAILTNAGYDQVDVFTTQELTVDFYRELPTMDYDFIVFRTHALAIKDPGKHSVWMFTGEKYTEDKYIGEQLAGKVSRAVPFLTTAAVAQGFQEAAKERHFIVGSEFVKEEMKGNFPGTIMILGGCDTLSYPHMAQALVERGASNIIGWYGLVSLFDNDRVVLKVMDEILTEGKDPDDAVTDTMKFYEGAMQYNHSIIRHFSSGATWEV